MILPARFDEGHKIVSINIKTITNICKISVIFKNKLKILEEELTIL